MLVLTQSGLCAGNWLTECFHLPMRILPFVDLLCQHCQQQFFNVFLFLSIVLFSSFFYLFSVCFSWFANFVVFSLFPLRFSVCAFFQFLIIFSSTILISQKQNPNPHRAQTSSRLVNVLISLGHLFRRQLWFVSFCFPRVVSRCRFHFHFVRLFLFFNTQNKYCHRLSILYCALTAATCATTSFSLRTTTTTSIWGF